MEYGAVKRGTAMVLALAMLGTACGGRTASKEEADQVAVKSVETRYEQDYVNQHLQYLKSAEYRTIASTGGNLATGVAETYENANLNLMNQAWSKISKASMLVNGKAQALENEYEVLYSELMQNSASVENFESCYEYAMYGAFYELFAGIKGVLEDTNGKIGQTASLGTKKTKEITGKIDTLLIFIQDMQGIKRTSPKAKNDDRALFADAVAEVQNKLDASFLGTEDEAKNKRLFLGELQDGLGIAQDVTGSIADTLDDFMAQYVLLRASQAATDEWCRGWEAVAEYARSSDGGETERMSKALDSMLNRVQDARNNPSEAVLSIAKSSSLKEIAKLGYGKAVGLFRGMTEEIPLVTYSLDALGKGVEISNKLLNVDDTAYYGQMLIGCGVTALYAQNAMEDAAAKLEKSKSYQDALQFDALFHIYKNIQISACDYTIKYYTAMVDNPVGKVLPNYDAITESWQLQAEKLTWENFDCHKSMYYNYILDEYKDVPGLLETGKKEYTSVTSDCFGWDGREGILSAAIADFDGDGTDDMALLLVEPDDENADRKKLTISFYSMENGDVSWQNDVKLFDIDNEMNLSANLLVYKAPEQEGEAGTSTNRLLLECYRYSLVSDSGTPIYAVYDYDGEALRETMYLQQTEGGSTDQGYGIRSWNAEQEAQEEYLAYADMELRYAGKSGKYDEAAVNQMEMVPLALEDYGFPAPLSENGQKVFMENCKTWVSGYGYPSWLETDGFTRVATLSNGGTSQWQSSDGRWHFWMDYNDGSKLRETLDEMGKYRK